VIGVELTAEARADLDEIDMFGVERFAALVSDGYMAAFHDAFDMLANFPEAGVVVSGRTDGVRVTLVGRHRLLYRRENDAVVILRVIHTSRDWPRLLN
jgi:toxin ParE1/3/4